MFALASRSCCWAKLPLKRRQTRKVSERMG
jgi:hypothetical protein